MDSRAAVLTGSDVGDVNKISSGLCRGKIAATVSPLQIITMSIGLVNSFIVYDKLFPDKAHSWNSRYLFLSM